MEEPRRIALETAKPTVKEKIEKPTDLTPRFTLKLVSSDSKNYAEYSYNELLKNVLKGSNENGEKDPFGDSNDDVDSIRAMAQKFEEKYGPKPGKPKRSEHWEDLIDKGLGYDETDPFIDNDEAYDELVPSSITTRHGGFYINMGELEFRTVSSDSEPFPYNPVKKKKKKKKLKDLIEKSKKKKRMIIRDDDDDDYNFIPLKKKGKKHLLPPLDEPNNVQPEIKKKIKPISVEVKEIPPVNSNPILSPKSKDPSLTKVNVESEVLKEANSVSSSSDVEEHVEKNPDQPHEVPKLPENLPSDLDSYLEKIKKAALTSAEGKCKFFSGEVNDILLNIELKSRELSVGNRTMIYAHLASHLPCTKETLQKRAKKLRLDQEDNKLKEPMEKLRKAVEKVMPEQKEKYIAECKAAAAAQEMIEKRTEGKEEEEKKMPRIPRKKFGWTSEIRSLFCGVVEVKLKCLGLMKTRTQSIEELLSQFFESEVKHIWPTGWMNARILIKESKSVCGNIAKVKKVSIIPKKVSVPVTTSSITTTSSSTKAEITPLSADQSAILSSMKNNSLSKISETAALPSISKLIQQTKVSLFPEVSPHNNMFSPPINSTCEGVKEPSKTDISITPTSISIPKTSESKSVISIQPVLKSNDVTKVSDQNLSILQKSASLMPENKNTVIISKTVSSKPSTSTSGKYALQTDNIANSSKLPSSSPVTSTKDQLISKESSAIDVLDQIINASLGNHRNASNTKMFSNSSKLVDNALLSLVNAQSKSSEPSSISTQPSFITNAPTSNAPIKSIPAVSIVKTSNNKQSPNFKPLSVSQSEKLDPNKSVLQNSADTIFKSFERYLNETSSTQSVSVTPIQSGKVRSNLLSLNQTPNLSPMGANLSDSPASYRSSYGFHEAFLNSLSGNNSEISQNSKLNVMRHQEKPKDLLVVSQSNQSPLKKQDFYSQNKASLSNISKNKQAENIPKSNASFMVPRSSPISIEKANPFNPVLPSNNKPLSKNETIYTNAAESLASIVNLTMDKPKKSVAQTSTHSLSKPLIHSSHDFTQDRLASGLLHHASSFSPDKLLDRNPPVSSSLKLTSKYDEYNLNKSLTVTKTPKELNRTSPIIPNISMNNWTSKCNNIIVNNFSPPVTVNETSVLRYKHSSPSSSMPKAQNAPPTPVSTQHANYQVSHQMKPYTQSVSQSTSALQNQMSLQQGCVYPPPSLPPMSLPHSVEPNLLQTDPSIFGQIPNYNQQSSHRNIK